MILSSSGLLREPPLVGKKHAPDATDVSVFSMIELIGAVVDVEGVDASNVRGEAAPREERERAAGSAREPSRTTKTLGASLNEEDRKRCR